MKQEFLLLPVFNRIVGRSSSAVFNPLNDDGVDSLLAAEVYNLFIVATIVSLFVCNSVSLVLV